MKRTLLLCLLCAACEPPWKLLETGSLTDSLVSITAVGDEVWVGSDVGRVLWLGSGANEFEDVLLLNAQGQEVSPAPVLGFTPGTAGDLYTWLPSELLRRTSGSFST